MNSTEYEQFYMTWYLLVFSDKKKAAGYAWGLMGLTAKLAQSVRPDFTIDMLCCR
jgi:hypothetical protein